MEKIGGEITCYVNCKIKKKNLRDFEKKLFPIANRNKKPHREGLIQLL